MQQETKHVSTNFGRRQDQKLQSGFRCKSTRATLALNACILSRELIGLNIRGAPAPLDTVIGPFETLSLTRCRHCRCLILRRMDRGPTKRTAIASINHAWEV